MRIMSVTENKKFNRFSQRAIMFAVICSSIFVTGPLGPNAAHAADDDEEPLVRVIREIRPSVVAVGSYLFNDTPTVRYFGTGFVCYDGNTVATNAHVVAALEQTNRIDHLRVFFPDGAPTSGRKGKVVQIDRFHDVALIRFEGPAAKNVKLVPPPTANHNNDPPQGRSVAILGYPIGTRLGLVPAVHKGVVAAVVPAVLPLPKGAKITPELAAAIKKPYNLYQLDMVAFPGNSGSPLFNARTGTVVGIINMTLAKKTREHLFDKPSGIAYAVPMHWLHELIRRQSILDKRNAASNN